ncbi:MAG: hypothetical protein V4450_03950 [Bacteroidota bacterium]
MQTLKQISCSLVKLGLLSILLLTACSKDPVTTPDPGTNPPPASGKKISKIEYDGGSYESVEYNSNGTIAKITNHIVYSTGTPYHLVYSFVYTGTVLNEVRGDDGTKFKYTYANQQVIKTELYSAGGNLVAYYDYTYTNGKLTRTDGYNRIPGGTISTTPTMRYDKEYLSSGNLKKMIIYFRNPTTGGLEKSSEYLFNDYDNKRNTTAVFENNPYLPLDSLIPNNPLTELHYDMNGTLEDTVAHTYTYDADGNPLTRKTVIKSVGYPDMVENATFYY